MKKNNNILFKFDDNSKIDSIYVVKKELGEFHLNKADNKFYYRLIKSIPEVNVDSEANFYRTENSRTMYFNELQISKLLLKMKGDYINFDENKIMELTKILYELHRLQSKYERIRRGDVQVERTLTTKYILKLLKAKKNSLIEQLVIQKRELSYLNTDFKDVLIGVKKGDVEMQRKGFVILNQKNSLVKSINMIKKTIVEFVKKGQGVLEENTYQIKKDFSDVSIENTKDKTNKLSENRELSESEDSKKSDEDYDFSSIGM